MFVYLLGGIAVYALIMGFVLMGVYGDNECPPHAK